ncbi:MAG TPA: GTP-binding protein, partial [Candidatus Mcinerneyibacteriales bacterium]|nr:GTP-binding protein [Candidatus Mcinerneyibacteriales bacterium]
MNKIKNIAIIAHVDHGKTTLVDAMLRQTGVFRENQQVADRIMDSNDLEREKGITIFSKNASVHYKNYRINLVDTPGHADFGGEVQRILKMVDSVLLLVDASEGPMPQTKYVLKKSLELGLHPLVVVNKIDRPNARPHEVSGEVFDLFCDLGAQESQIDFPLVFASARDGYAVKELEDEKKDLAPLFEAILTHVPDASGDREHPFQLLVAATSYDNYVGMIGTGKIHSGVVQAGMEVACIAPSGEKTFEKITQIYSYEGMKRISIDEARAGDIISFAGVSSVEVGNTIADREYPHPLPTIEIDEPTIAMTFLVNNSPFAGKEGSYVTSRQLWERLEKEDRGNVSIRIERTDSPDAFTVKGRGELQLAILIENMRREGYEFQVSKPEVILKEIDGIRMEPFERAVIDVADEYAGAVIEMMGVRKGEMVHMIQGSDGYTRLEYIIPARGLIGFLNEFLTVTRGTGILNHTFHGY